MDEQVAPQIDYEAYFCQDCKKKGVCEEGMDVFVALLCKKCFDKVWEGYVRAVSGSDPNTDTEIDVSDIIYPEAFETQTLEILHNAFLRAANIIAAIGTTHPKYWDILNATFHILKAMNEIENASFEWRSYSDRLTEE